MEDDEVLFDLRENKKKKPGLSTLLNRKQVDKFELDIMMNDLE